MIDLIWLTSIKYIADNDNYLSTWLYCYQMKKNMVLHRLKTKVQSSVDALCSFLIYLIVYFRLFYLILYDLNQKVKVVIHVFLLNWKKKISLSSVMAIKCLDYLNNFKLWHKCDFDERKYFTKDLWKSDAVASFYDVVTSKGII